jgi:hypothetical protein
VISFCSQSCKKGLRGQPTKNLGLEPPRSTGTFSKILGKASHSYDDYDIIGMGEKENARSRI